MDPWDIPTAKLSSGAVVLQNAKVLLVRLNYGPAKGQWILPGGRVEQGEDILAALQREVMEETGVRVMANHFLAMRQRLLDSGVMDLYLVWRAEVIRMPGKLAAQDADEITAVEFWPIDKALGASEVRPMTKAALQLALSGKPYFEKRESPAGFLSGDSLFF